MIDGKYETFPDKMFAFEDGTVIYEGERNRTLRDFVMEIGDIEGLWMYDTTGGSNLDIPLATRVKVANDLNDRYHNVVFLSLHMNAGGGNGTEVFTSPGQTASDHHASLLIDTLEEDIEDLVIRSDFLSDGDCDKEERFYVLVKTTCPSILLEVNFMDTIHTARLLLDDDYLFEVAKSIVRYMKRAEEIELW